MNAFHNSQRPAIWMVLLILLLFFGLPTAGLIVQIGMQTPFGNNPMSDTGLILFSAGMYLVGSLFLFVRLQISIDEKGIYYRFFPFQRKYRLTPFDHITTCYVRESRPLREFGGWGFRYGRKGLAMTISGKFGIQIEKTDGTMPVFIGTSKPEEAEAFLKQINRFQPKPEEA